MSFSENLKEAMFCKGVITKELSEKTDIKADTINSYLKTKGSIPTADKAVKIAKVLNVSVEFLVNGFESKGKKLSKPIKHLPPEVLALESDLATLSSSDIKAISSVVKQLKEKY